MSDFDDFAEKLQKGEQVFDEDLPEREPDQEDESTNEPEGLPADDEEFERAAADAGDPSSSHEVEDGPADAGEPDAGNQQSDQAKSEKHQQNQGDDKKPSEAQHQSWMDSLSDDALANVQGLQRKLVELDHHARSQIGRAQGHARKVESLEKQIKSLEAQLADRVSGDQGGDGPDDKVRGALDAIKQDFPELESPLKEILGYVEAKAGKGDDKKDAGKSKPEAQDGDNEAQAEPDPRDQRMKEVSTQLLMERHPDVSQILPSQDWAYWLEVQPDSVRRAAMESDDPDVASRILDMYKADRERVRRHQQQAGQDAPDPQTTTASKRSQGDGKADAVARRRRDALKDETPSSRPGSTPDRSDESDFDWAAQKAREITGLNA